MAELKVNPTRMEMKKLQIRLGTARKGHKLLKDKRDELMKQFLDVVREDKTLRENVEKHLSDFYAGFAVAAAVSSPKMMEEALICPRRESKIEVDYKNVMSVIVPSFSTTISQDNSQNGINYGLAFTSGELDASLNSLASIIQELLRMAELEKTAQLLAEEIERTRRRVNALEYIMIPQYIATIKSIRMKLDENERSNTTRLMKVKDMMMEEQRGQKVQDEELEEAQ